MMHMQGDYRMFNATYPFKALLPVLEETDEKEACARAERDLFYDELTFFFSIRKITTTQDGQSIVTDFDGGFDSITGPSAGSESLIEVHIRSA